MKKIINNTDELLKPAIRRKEHGSYLSSKIPITDYCE
jgi:hypothetical protein